jgi:hypothetical protein
MVAHRRPIRARVDNNVCTFVSAVGVDDAVSSSTGEYRALIVSHFAQPRRLDLLKLTNQLVIRMGSTANQRERDQSESKLVQFKSPLPKATDDGVKQPLSLDATLAAPL